MACSPIGLISLMDRTLRPVIAKVRILFPVNPNFFQVLLFILLRKSCSLLLEVVVSHPIQCHNYHLTSQPIQSAFSRPFTRPPAFEGEKTFPLKLYPFVKGV